MALQKSKTVSSGAAGNYWRVTDVIVNRRTLSVVYKISLYLSKDIADSPAGSDLGCVKTFSFTVTKDQAAGDLTALGYTLIAAKANTMITKDLRGQTINPIPTDADLAGATNV